MPPSFNPILREQWVALDLETTGLSPKEDAIIEMGAVRFRGDRVLDSFSTLVNPGRRLGEFTLQLTGITQADVDGAPSPRAALADLAEFIGDSPVVGHNLRFDLAFLVEAGLRLTNPTCDTLPLAYVLRPDSPSYSLTALAAELKLGQGRPHRALDDASVTARLFAALAEEAAGIEVDLIAELDRAAQRSGSRLAYAMSSLTQQAEEGADATLGFDMPAVRGRIRSDPPLRPGTGRRGVDIDVVTAAFEAGGALERSIPGFESRREQVRMARAVAEAINASAGGGEGRLMVEAGTGVGKSLAYLLPAALYALANGTTVIVSTNTINLQEQLVSKDIPLVSAALSAMGESAGVPDASGLRATQLKGRANYLCLNRLMGMRAGLTLSEPEANLLSKVLLWLRETETGDRAEINLGGREAGQPWSRLSAQGASDCGGVAGTCFLRAARERAAAAHIVIVNHALLMADVATDGSILPDHDLLIVDEAHNLEDAATKQLGSEISQAGVQEQLSAISGPGGLLARAVDMTRAEPVSDSRRQAVAEVSAKLSEIGPRVRESISGLLAETGRLIEPPEGGRAGEGAGRDLRVTRGTRAQPAWSALEMSWERTDLLLADAWNSLSRLESAIDQLDQANLPGYSGLALDASAAVRAFEQLRAGLAEFILHPIDHGVYWISVSPASGRRPASVALHSAPLRVGEILESAVYAHTGAVVMTSATLTADGTFDHMVDRTGFEGAAHLVLGSPFDYPNAALLCLPEDIPEPSSWAYQGVVEQAVVDAAVAAGGHTMALFTSHASLRQAAKAIRPTLRPHDISVLAQTVDGAPHRIVANFLKSPRSVILGTASFWEGVDLPGDSLRVLLVARLPFAVPSDPLVAARAELFEDPFRQYSVPEAVLRLRQGFGRLIRTSSDRGVAVILDRRITSKGYGRTFLRSLPPARPLRMPLERVPETIGEFLGPGG